MNETGTIKLLRKSNVAAGLRKLDVLADGKKIGNIANGKEESFELPAGQHTVQVKLGLGSRSESIDVEILPNSSIDLECGIPSSFWKRNVLVLAMMFFLYTFGRQLINGIGIGLAVAVGVVILAIWVTRANYKAGATYYLKIR